MTKAMYIGWAFGLLVAVFLCAIINITAWRFGWAIPISALIPMDVALGAVGTLYGLYWGSR